MDCLRSFNFSIAQQSNWTAPDFKGWAVGAQHFWLLELSTAPGSKYIVEGFKNINVFKIEINGTVYSSALPVGVSAITNNWHTFIEVVGQNSQSAGTIVASPNPFGMVLQPINPTFVLSKFENTISFPSPIQSVRELIVKAFYAEGIANQLILNAQLGFILNFTVFYKYEGE